MSRRPWSVRLLRVAAGIGLAGAAGYGILLALMWTWIAKPPPTTHAFSITQEVAVVRGDRTVLGPNWLGEREGLPVLYLKGSAFERGYANGVLTCEQGYRLEQTMVDMLKRFVPWAWARFLLKVFVVFQNRNLPEHVIPEYQMEMLGLSRACPDRHPELGPVFNRILNFHAAQDVSYMLMNSPLIRRGCTAFGAWGAVTSGGHLLCGRNFDWEAACVFDKDRIVVVCEPDKGLPFISLSWAGMVGCVSGMNREGLSLAINGAPSDLPGRIATPTCLIGREILQYARNLEEAVRIIESRKVFVSSLFLLGSRRDGRFIVVEKTPERTVRREPGAGDFLVCANHYLTPELRDTKVNKLYLEADTSLSRFLRAEELITRQTGHLDAPATAAILRDRRLPGDVFAGNGHRASLNPLIATHSAIMDLTDGIFWAASPPHQLGRYVAFDVADIERKLPDLRIPEDPFLSNGGYSSWLASREALARGEQAVKQKDGAEAIREADNAEALNPGFYENAWLQGEGHRLQGNSREALRAYHAARTAFPPMASDRSRVERRVRELEEASPP